MMEALKFLIKYFTLGITLIASGFILTRYIRLKYFNK